MKKKKSEDDGKATDLYAKSTWVECVRSSTIALIACVQRMLKKRKDEADNERRNQQAAERRAKSKHSTKKEQGKHLHKNCQHLKETNQAFKHMTESRTLTVSITSKTERKAI
jgi:hypothetical protein